MVSIMGTGGKQGEEENVKKILHASSGLGEKGRGALPPQYFE